MHEKLLDYLRCPDCIQKLELVTFDTSNDEISEGLLYCENEHCFPIVRGIPRMLPNSLQDNWVGMASRLPSSAPASLVKLLKQYDWNENSKTYDTRTKANFSNEWENHDLGGRTWTMELSDRIQWFFLDPIHMQKRELNGKTLLDAGCGNGSQSVAYTEFGLEVVAVDLSTGLEKGYAFRQKHPSAIPDKVHFVQADLQNPPLAHGSFDIIHSAGVLHHTPSTKKTFRALRPLLKNGGTFYVWLYKYERIVTPVVNSIRVLTTRISATTFAKLADLGSVPLIVFCWLVNKLGIRKYKTPDRKEAALALHDIFGAPYAHYHSLTEVSDWYRSEGFVEIWGCNESRRGFGVCGRMADVKSEIAAEKRHPNSRDASSQGARG